jgi:hypothetical protein
VTLTPSIDAFPQLTSRLVPEWGCAGCARDEAGRCVRIVRLRIGVHLSSRCGRAGGISRRLDRSDPRVGGDSDARGGVSYGDADAGDTSAAMRTCAPFVGVGMNTCSDSDYLLTDI